MIGEAAFGGVQSCATIVLPFNASQYRSEIQPSPAENAYSNSGQVAEIKKKSHKRITYTPNVSIHTFVQEDGDLIRANERLESAAQLREPLGMSIDQSTLVGIEDHR